MNSLHIASYKRFQQTESTMKLYDRDCTDWELNIYRREKNTKILVEDSMKFRNGNFHSILSHFTIEWISATNDEQIDMFGLMCELHKCVWHWMISLRCLPYFASLSVCLLVGLYVSQSKQFGSRTVFFFASFSLDLISFFPIFHSIDIHIAFAHLTNIMQLCTLTIEFINIWLFDFILQEFQAFNSIDSYTCVDWAELPQYFHYIDESS